MKNYMKPAVSFQVFNLAGDVSGGCNMSANADPYKCPVDIPNWPGDTVFSDGKTCTYVTDNPEEYGVCYQGPIGITSVLGS